MSCVIRFVNQGRIRSDLEEQITKGICATTSLFLNAFRFVNSDLVLSIFLRFKFT